MIRTTVVSLASTVLLARAGRADDLWSGLYAGGHAGYARGAATTRAGDAGTAASSGFGMLGGGLQLGYGARQGARVLGLETDVSFPNFLDGDDRLSSVRTPSGDAEEHLDAMGSVRARAGWLLRPATLVYATGGLAWARGHFADAGLEQARLRGGWTAGAGVELAVAPAWTARIEWRWEQLARAGAEVAGVPVASTAGMQGLWLGLSWHLFSGASSSASSSGPLEATGDPLSPPAEGAGLPPRPPEERAAEGEATWNVHGQTTFVGQGHGTFRSPYEGANSLTGGAQVRNTMSATMFVGARAWSGAELYVNPELMQGFGLDDTHGVAAFPNGEAQRSNFPVPRFNVARLYLSQTFGLGGEREAVEDGPNQLAGERDVSRITVTAGKLAVTDFFLVNSYAGEPRTGFLNWNVYGGGSYDWTMDLLSWTWGGLVELNQRSWAGRAGYFLLPAVSNTNRFDLDVPRNGQWTAELEVRHQLLGRTGKLQLFGWLSHGNIGSYPAALATAAATGQRPDVGLTRGQDRYNSGAVVSLEQPVTDDLGLFSRVSWSPERGETMGWTDCGESFSLGGVLKGTGWRRPRDTVGVAALVEGLSPVARRYLAEGGMGTIIGDGALAYRPETVLETYYTAAAGASTALTLDHQLIVNPAYNADRGPVSVLSVRVHASF